MDIENPKAVPRLVIGIPLYLSELYVIACGRYGAFADNQASQHICGMYIYASKGIL